MNDILQKLDQRGRGRGGKEGRSASTHASVAEEDGVYTTRMRLNSAYHRVKSKSTVQAGVRN